MAATARQILAANPDIVDRIMEHMTVRPLVPLRSEDWVPQRAKEQPQATEEENQKVAEASQSTRSSLVFLRTSPMGKLHLTPKKEVVFSLGLSQQTSSVQIGVEGTSSKPIQVENQLEVVGANPEGEAD